MRRIYLDHSATTPVRQEVVEAMLPYFTSEYGNASSVHGFGQRARHAIESARESIAALLSARPDEIVFTSGGTESDNIAILGTAAVTRRRHVITSAVEHHAVLNTCTALEKHGFTVVKLSVDKFGVVHPDALRQAVKDADGDVALVAADGGRVVVDAVRPHGGRARCLGADLG